MNLTIYHNPRCSKSRETLALLRDAGIEPSIVEYLNCPPDHEQLTALHAALGVDVRQMVRFKEALAKELGLYAKDERSDDAWIQVLAENPRLLERPIVTNGEQARIGRPPESVRELLNSSNGDI